jgi:hypothetical protein
MTPNEFDDCDWWYDYGKFDAENGRESAHSLIRCFDGDNAAIYYAEGYGDYTCRAIDSAFEDFDSHR